MRKVSSGHFLSINSFYSALLADSEGPDQTAKAQSDLGLRCPHMPEDTVSHGVARMVNNIFYVHN